MQSALVTCKFCGTKISQTEMFAHHLDCNQQNHPNYQSHIQSGVESQINPQQQNQSRFQQSGVLRSNVPKPSQVEPLQRSNQSNSRFVPPQQNNNRPSEQNQQYQNESLIISQSQQNNKQEFPSKIQQEPQPIQPQNPQQQQSRVNQPQNLYSQEYTQSLISKTVKKCEHCQEEFPAEFIEDHYNVCESFKQFQEIANSIYNEPEQVDYNEPRNERNEGPRINSAEQYYSTSIVETTGPDNLIKRITTKSNPYTGAIQRTEEIIDPRTNERIVISTTSSSSNQHQQINFNISDQEQMPRLQSMPHQQPFPTMRQGLFNFQQLPQMNYMSGISGMQSMRGMQSMNGMADGLEMRRGQIRNFSLHDILKDLFGKDQYEEIQEHLTIIKFAPYNDLSPEYKQCSICFSEYQDGEELILLPCLHRFHKECIKKWFQEQLSCPICKLDIRKELMPYEGEIDQEDEDQ